MDFLFLPSKKNNLDSNINPYIKQDKILPKINFFSNTETTIKCYLETEQDHILFGTNEKVKGHIFASHDFNQPLKGFSLTDLLNTLKEENIADTFHFLVEAGTLFKQSVFEKRVFKIANKFDYEFSKKIPILNSRSYYLEYKKLHIG